MREVEIARWGAAIVTHVIYKCQYINIYAACASRAERARDPQASELILFPFDEVMNDARRRTDGAAPRGQLFAEFAVSGYR